MSAPMASAARGVTRVLILALLGYFAFMWAKEKGRSDNQSADSARQHTETRGTPPGNGGTGV